MSALAATNASNPASQGASGFDMFGELRKKVLKLAGFREGFDRKDNKNDVLAGRVEARFAGKDVREQSGFNSKLANHGIGRVLASGRPGAGFRPQRALLRMAAGRAYRQTIAPRLREVRERADETRLFQRPGRPGSQGVRNLMAKPTVEMILELTSGAAGRSRLLRAAKSIGDYQQRMIQLELRRKEAMEHQQEQLREEAMVLRLR